MALERLNQDNNINIQHLALEKPPQLPELKFNPETEITERDWERLDKILRRLQVKDNVDLMTNAMKISLLSPQRVKMRIEELDLPRTLETRIAHLQSTEANKFPRGLLEYLQLSVAKKVFSGGNSVPEPHGEHALNEAVRQSFVLNRDRDWDKYYELLTWAAIAFPEKSEEIQSRVSDQAKQGLSKEIVNELKDPPADDPWLKIFNKASCVTLLSPDINVRQYFSNENWREAKKELKEYRQYLEGASDLFIDLSLAMKIVAAEEVKMGERGLQFKMTEQNIEEQKVESLPNQRKF